MRHAHQPAVLHYDQDVKTRKIHVPSKAPPPPLRGTSPAAAGEALWAANRTSALSIAAHPVKKDLSIAKIMQIYTIGGLRASKQTLAEQVSKACGMLRRISFVQAKRV